MHDYMRAIGFSHEFTRDNFKRLLTKVVTEADYRNATGEDGALLVEYRKFFGQDVGLIMRGTLESTSSGSEEIFADETIPFLRTTAISSTEKIYFRKKMDREAYIGICDDYRLGMPLMFHLQNRNDYLSQKESIENNPIDILHLSLCALSLGGTVLLPIDKKIIPEEEADRKRQKRDRMMRMAHLGDEQAREDMVIEDMDTYTILREKSKSEDVYSLVDSYFMPGDVECDEYSVLGEIKDVSEDINSITGEELWIMDIVANGLFFSVCIHKDDLLGEPEIGRRFKGTIWMQGTVAF